MTRLAILWHMHQPFYEDLATGEHILPWVRLHAIKDYWGMAALLREFPGVRVTFNLVPSLLVQIQAFAEDRAQDRHLEVGLKPAESLDEVDRRFLVDNGFHAPVERMIRPYPRYAELYARRHDPDIFTIEDLRDLQVLHKLVWMDPDLLVRDERLVKLVGKRQHYTEADKAVLRAIELELLNLVIPAFKGTAETGQIELSTSPFYHPILPLLCDSDVYLRAHPHSALPGGMFARPEDAVDQLERALAYHQSIFGGRPAGIWPSEGSVSDEVLSMLARVGCRWTASDEEILARSLGRPVSADALYRPYEFATDGRALRCLFRDHTLSDLIGFTYQSWDADQAASDFVAKVREASRRFRSALRSNGESELATVTVILDGENAWEHYPGGGRPFLRALYRQLAASIDIETVTMSEAASGPARTISSIFPGSWINGDFYIWAGHPDDHRAWLQLAEARAAFDQHAHEVDPAERAHAWEELLIAEGSDWFWWYGDDHSSDHDRQFDELFRRHLRNVYRALRQPAPDQLYLTNITTEPRPGGPLRMPTAITPTLDGRVTDFSEWEGALVVPLGATGSTMHRVDAWRVRALAVAANRTAIFLRLDGPNLVSGLVQGELGLAVLTDRPDRRRLQIPQGPAADGTPFWVADVIVEVVLPFAAAGVQAGDFLRVVVLVTDLNGHVLEQHPALDPVEIKVPTRHVTAIDWWV